MNGKKEIKNGEKKHGIEKKEEIALHIHFRIFRLQNSINTMRVERIKRKMNLDNPLPSAKIMYYNRM